MKKVLKGSMSIHREIRKNDFRVTIFGSARVKKGTAVYKQVHDLAKKIAQAEFDVITGGGPGLMEAANEGHAAGDGKQKSESIGLVIKLPWENEGNKFLEIQKKFDRFSERLDTFMALSNAIVVMPGGVGTCLEFFYSWQLIQVKHVQSVPIILVGKMWEELMAWVKKYPIKKGLISPNEANCIHIAKNNKEAMEIIMNEHKKFKKLGKSRQKRAIKYLEG